MEIILCIAFILGLLSLTILLIETLRVHSFYGIEMFDAILYILGFIFIFIGYIIFFTMLIFTITGIL